LKQNALVKLILWIKSIYNNLDPNSKQYALHLADTARQRLVDEGVIKDPINDPVVGKNTSFEKGMKNLGLSQDYDITPEQQTVKTLQNMGIDTGPLKLIMPSLFASQSSQTSQTSQTSQSSQTSSQGTTVPSYNQTSSGKASATTTTSIPAPTGSVPIRDFMKDVYGISADQVHWDNTRGLTIKTGDKEINLGKPTSPDEGQIINGTWFTNPSYVETALSANGIQRQKDPIREALPQYLESKGIKGATVSFDNNNNQVVLNLNGQSYNLGAPSQIGSVYDGTTFVNQDDIEKALSPIADKIGLPKNPEDMTVPEIKLNEEINQAGVMNKTYDQLVSDIKANEDSTNPNSLISQIHNTYSQLIKDSLATMDNALTKATQALEATKGNYDSYEQAAYQEIDKNVQAAKDASETDMAARGIYFSGLTTRAMNNIEAQGVSEKNKVNMQVLQYKAQIDSQIAIMTANNAMSESQLQNEMMAREALDKLQLIETDKNKIDAINQQKAMLDSQIEVDKLNLPLENELYRRQAAMQSQQQAMDYMEKIYIPMLKLQYQDKWKQQDLDLSYMKYQQSVLSFFNDTQEFWAKLGFDEDKFKATFLWDKEKFATEMGLKEAQANAQNSTQTPTWLDRYKTFLTMRPDLQDDMLSKQVMLDGNGNEVKDAKGLPIGIPPGDLNKLTVLKGFLDSLEPENNGDFLSSFNTLIDTFGDKGAGDVLNYANTSNGFKDLDILKRIYSTAGSLQNFATAYYALQQKADSGDKDSQTKITNFINNFEQETGANKYDIMKIFSFIFNKYNLTFTPRG
jgi:hypothetical protein